MGKINDVGMPFDSVAADRQYGADAWRDFFDQLVTSGLVSDAASELQVKPQAAPNKTVYVDTGAILIRGAMRIMAATTNLSIADNASGNSRIDRIVARLNYADRKIEFVVKQGTPGVSPVAPALTRNGTYWELSLAKITLANGYTTITAGNITDERRDDTVCGYAKTIYMQSFDDENNLLKYNRDVTVLDASGNPTEIRYVRPADSSLFLKRVMSNPDAKGRYQTVVETFYLPNGTTAYKTVTYALTFLDNGIVDTMTRTVV